MKKILIVFGTRPEAIKMAPIVLALKRQSNKFETKICITAQHREMLDQVLQIFLIKPDFDLDLMRPGQDLFDITSNICLSIRKVFDQYKPDLVMVHGDTTTSFVTTLSAYYMQIPVAHVEAGLRTNNIYSPFPEEINRQLTARIASLHFAPTEKSKLNLFNEGIKSNVFVTGNTVIDALHLVLKKIKESPEASEDINSFLLNNNIDLNGKRKIVLITGHRRENFGEAFLNICEAIKGLALEYPEVDFIYPVHLNPNVQKPVYDLLKNVKNVILLPPLEYTQFAYLMSKSYLLLTDSGGIQEEGPSLGKPVLVMRDTTERPEAVDAGTVKLVGTDKNEIIKQTSLLLDSKEEYEKMSKAINPYGDGTASNKIIDILNEYLK